MSSSSCPTSSFLLSSLMFSFSFFLSPSRPSSSSLSDPLSRSERRPDLLRSRSRLRDRLALRLRSRRSSLRLSRRSSRRLSRRLSRSERRPDLLRSRSRLRDRLLSLLASYRGLLLRLSRLLLLCLPLFSSLPLLWLRAFAVSPRALSPSSAGGGVPLPILASLAWAARTLAMAFSIFF